MWKENVHVIPVVRGGADYSKYFPEGTYISASEFSSPEELGRHLLRISNDEIHYLDMLWRKAHFVLHQRGHHDAFCQMCYKLHHLDTYKNSYADLYSWINVGNKSCYGPTDL